jgi:methyl coenzyme M reductase subunit C
MVPHFCAVIYLMMAVRHLLFRDLKPLSQALHDQLLTCTAPVDIFDIVRGRFEMATCVITPRDEHTVFRAVVDRFVEWDGWALLGGRPLATHHVTQQ